MILSDVSVKRPVFASVISLLLIAFGLVAFDRLPLREYPRIDPPIVTVSTGYRGAAATVVESRITKIVEDRIAGIEGIQYIQSVSTDGNSRVTIEFDIERVSGLKSMFFGGEGLFLATLSGTGTVWIQSLPFSRLADRVIQHAPSQGGSRQGEGSVLGSIGDIIDGD